MERVEPRGLASAPLESTGRRRREWVDLTDVSLPFVSFRMTFIFEADGAILTSDSTLSFRSQAEIEDSLHEAGFVVKEIRDAPDRPSREFVFIAERTSEHA